MASAFSIPAPVHAFFSKFPLYTYPAADVASARNAAGDTHSTLWIAPPPRSTAAPGTNTTMLSADVECLKWQAYIALRGVREVRVRWDVAAEGAVDARLPSLLAVRPGAAELLAARAIPGWVDEERGGQGVGELEGYRDAQAKDESRAWVALLEGVVHAALILSTPRKVSLKSLLLYTPSLRDSKAAHTQGGAKPDDLAAVLSPPPAPLTGFASLFPSYGARVSMASIQSRYHDAVVSLSDRLGEDEWFLNSEEPTALDALAFAYLHCLLGATDDVRIDVARRANLVNYERSVRSIVEAAFIAE